MNADGVPQKLYTPADCMRLLDDIFKNEVLDSQKENAFNFIESNFGKL